MRRTKNEMRDYFIKIVNDAGGIVIGEYISSVTPIECVCAFGHTCYPRPGNAVKTGRGICSVCAQNNAPARHRQADSIKLDRSREKFLAVLAGMGAELIGEYRGTNVPVEIRCIRNHISKPQPTAIINKGADCTVCAHGPSKETEKLFRSLIDQLGGRIVGDYIRANHSITVQCANGHETQTSPAVITTKGYIPCINCKRTGNTKISQSRARFINALAELEATLIGEYKGTHIKTSIQCVNGHVNTILPMNLLKSNPQGICITCSGSDTRIAEAKFRECLRNASATLIDPWRGVKYAHHVTCKAGHDCYPYPDNILNAGKPICSRCSGTWDVFYVVSSPTVVKFGITTGDVRQRIFAHRTNGYRKTHRVFSGIPGGGAIHLERQVKAMLASKGFIPVRGREYFDISSLSEILAYVDAHRP